MGVEALSSSSTHLFFWRKRRGSRCSLVQQRRMWRKFAELSFTDSHSVHSSKFGTELIHRLQSDSSASTRADVLQSLASASKSKAHVNRNLMTAIRKHGVTVDVRLETVQISVQVLTPRIRTISVRWPILPMQAWLEALCRECAFATFWEKFAYCFPDRIVYQSGRTWRHAYPSSVTEMKDEVLEKYHS